MILRMHVYIHIWSRGGKIHKAEASGFMHHFCHFMIGSDDSCNIAAGGECSYQLRPVFIFFKYELKRAEVRQTGFIHTRKDLYITGAFFQVIWFE